MNAISALVAIVQERHFFCLHLPELWPQCRKIVGHLPSHTGWHEKDEDHRWRPGESSGNKTCFCREMANGSEGKLLLTSCIEHLKLKNPCGKTKQFSLKKGCTLIVCFHKKMPRNFKPFIDPTTIAQKWQAIIPGWQYYQSPMKS